MPHSRHELKDDDIVISMETAIHFELILWTLVLLEKLIVTQLVMSKSRCDWPSVSQSVSESAVASSLMWVS